MLLKLDPYGQVRRLWILPETPMVAKAHKCTKDGSELKIVGGECESRVRGGGEARK